MQSSTCTVIRSSSAVYLHCRMKQLKMLVSWVIQATCCIPKWNSICAAAYGTFYIFIIFKAPSSTYTSRTKNNPTTMLEIATGHLILPPWNSKTKIYVSTQCMQSLWKQQTLLIQLIYSWFSWWHGSSPSYIIIFLLPCRQNAFFKNIFKSLRYAKTWGLPTATSSWVF